MKFFLILSDNTRKLSMLFFVSLLLLTLSCRNSDVKEGNIEEKKDLILELHDDLMLDLPEIKRIKSHILTQAKDSSSKIKSSQLADMAIIYLDNADKEMWDWMHDFNISYEVRDDSLTLVYFDKEYIKLLDVKADMDSAIDTGKKMISNYEHAQ